MAVMLTRVAVDDYEAWKAGFDSDPYGARAKATGHRIVRAVEDPSEVFVQVEFPTAEDAHEARQKLIDGGMLDRVAVKNGPTVAEIAERVEY